MATTAIIPIHAGKGKPVATALKISTEYIKNPDKTDGGELVSAYECDPLIADKEFMFSKSQYAATTGRSQGKRDVIAYHLRISFKPGETDAETANRIGYELAMKLTKGNHAFVCATHIDKAHTHSHIVINSTSLDCTRKFRNFKNSSFAIRKIADRLCIENGLSIIEKPQYLKGKNYSKWQGKSKPPSNREKLKNIIDDTLCVGNTYGEFLARMKQAGCEVKLGKNAAFKLPETQRFIRLSSMDEGYTEADIQKRLAGLMDIIKKSQSGMPGLYGKTPSLLIDIERKLQEVNNSPAYKHWATIHNIKAMANTLIWLKDNKIDSYDDLVQKQTAATAIFKETESKLRDIEKRQKEISDLQKSIGTYSKTKAIYAQYRQSGWSKKFYNEHADEIKKHRAAKKHFDELGYGKDRKLPSINQLKQEYAACAEDRRIVLGNYENQKRASRNLLIARKNAEEILDIKSEDLTKEYSEIVGQNKQAARTNAEKRHGTKPSIMQSLERANQIIAQQNVPQQTAQKRHDYGAR